MTLKKDLSLFGAKPEELNPYETHFLLENPFPGHGETGFDVCTDQNEIKKEFIYILRNFSDASKRLRINGKTGAGKTNVLQYFEQLTGEARRSKFIKNLYPIYISAPGESYFNVHGQIVDKLTGLFLTDVVNTLKSEPDLIQKFSSEVQSASEFLTVMKAIAYPTQKPLYPLQEERQQDAFIRWLKGQKLTAVDKKFLTDDGVAPIDVTSPSLAIRFLYGLLAVLQELDLCEGIILLFDEFEEIFEGLTRSYQSRYAQDLRHLFDILKESVFFVIATTPEPRDLEQYPAIERRLGDPVELKPIDSPKLAINYVSDYLNSGRNKYETYLKEKENESEHTRPDGLKPLTRQVVEEEYLTLKKEGEKAGLNVLPGHFLPKMRERMRQIVESGD
ncbi:MAG: DUF2791 family P-loop domain-containing protein [Candidatus Poribacteria bacterium]|nr:DUF2791 family P-loop domain-containing protein [Candidatus Poribacteria bacterium]